MKTLLIFLAGLTLAGFAPGLRAAAPVATTGTANNVTVTNANLRGTVNPKSAATQAWFEWGTTTNYGNATAMQAIGSGSSAVSVSNIISNLISATKYHFRMFGSNSSGIDHGADATFTTHTNPPVVRTLAASDVTQNSATLNAAVNPQNVSATVAFQWGTTTNYGNTTVVQSLGAGTNEVAVAAALAGLAQATSYHYRAVATNKAGVTYGSNVVFATLPPQQPLVLTLNPTNITANSATLNGSANPNGATTSAFFEWGTTTNYGSATATQVLSGNVAVAVQQSATGLSPRTTYQFRMVAQNAYGVDYGSNSSFTTKGPAAIAITENPSVVQPDGAVFASLVNPNGSDTTVFFQWGQTTNYANSDAGFLLSSNSPPGQWEGFYGPLLTQTTYNYRIVAVNEGGTSYGSNVSFTTPPPGAPIIYSSGLNSVGNTNALFGATLYANGSSAKVFFQWGATTNYGSVTTNQTVSGPQSLNISAVATGLMPSTAYHFRVVASNAVGVTRGGDMTFATYGPPQAISSAVSNLSATAGTFNGTVNPNGIGTSAAFQWGTTTNYGNTTASISVPAGSSPVAIQATLTNLIAGTTYHYRAVATNSAGISLGGDITFTPPFTAPSVITTPAGNITTNSATLNGSANPNGLSASAYFEWGSTTNYGNTTATVSLPAGSTPVALQADLTNLLADTTYHYRAVAMNGGGTTFGSNIMFKTLVMVPLVTTMNPTNITINSATLNGTVNPNNLATSAYFEWGLTTNYGLTTTAQVLGAGSAPVAVQANLSPLLTDTNYHYRLVASNVAGITYGNDVIVTPTLLLYLYAGESWSYAFHDLPLYAQYTFSDTPRANCGFGILPGSFAPGSTLRFEVFADSTNQGAANSQLVTTAGGGYMAMYPSQLWLNDFQGAARLTMLTGSVVVSSMFFQQIAIRTGGCCTPEYGNTIITTRRPQPAALANQFVSSITITSAVVSANIDAKNLPTKLFVQWGATTNYGSASGATTVDRDYFVTQLTTVSNLAPGASYHLRVVATNSAGTTYGNDLMLTTLSPATVVTQPADNRKTTSATLNATAYLNGLATTAYFDWGTTTNYNQVTPLQNLGNPIAATNVAAPLTGLTPQTTYHCRAVVFSSGVTNFGSDIAFITTPPPTNVVVTNCVTDDVRGAIERGGLVTFACDGVMVLTNQIQIANDVCLDATGHSITFSGSNVTRIFQVLPSTLLTLTNITLANGRSINGGAIYNDGNVIAYDCRFFSNVVIGATGTTGTNGLDGTNSPNSAMITPGTPAGPGSDGQNASGGAIYSSGNLTLGRCLFITNSALGGAGGQGGMGGRGGQSSISSPLYYQPGGAGGNGGAGGKALGGAIASVGLVKVEGCTFSNSFVGSGTGGKAGAGGFQYASPYNGPGGTGGTGGLVLGGALLAKGQTFVSNSVFVGNSGVGANGGDGPVPYQPAYLGSGGTAMGGAIYGGSNGVVVNCTFVTNSVRGGNIGNGFGYVNGGDATGGAIAGAGILQAVNLTLYGNTAIGGQGYCCGYGTNGNSYGGSIANTGGVFQIVNSILSGGFSNNCFGAITDLGHNISSDATPAWTSGTSSNNTDPLLLPLADNGGPTLTMALRTGSPALNNADCASAPPTDQRGYPRPNGPGCDIGAYEGPGTPQLQIIRENTSTNMLRWMAEASRSYRLEATTNFNGWSPMATNTASTNGWLEFHVPANPPRKYFRLMAQ